MGDRKIQFVVKTVGVEKASRMVYGYAMVAKVGGVPYKDTQGDVISEEEIIKSALDFAKHSQVVGDMHDGGGSHGAAYFLFPLTGAIAKSLDLEWTAEATVNKHGPGLLIGAQLSPEAFGRVEKGERMMWSIEGTAERHEIPEAA